MERIVERCCGLDVGQKTVAACVRIAAPDGGRQQVIWSCPGFVDA